MPIQKEDNKMSNWKSLALAVFIAPLATYPATALAYIITWPISQGNGLEIEAVFLIASIGMILFSYPATLVLGLSIYGLSKLKWFENTWSVYVGTAVAITILIFNKELFEGDGLFGVIYLTSAACCSLLFWYLAIDRPNKPDIVFEKTY